MTGWMWAKRAALATVGLKPKTPQPTNGRRICSLPNIRPSVASHTTFQFKAYVNGSQLTSCDIGLVSYLSSTLNAKTVVCSTALAMNCLKVRSTIWTSKLTPKLLSISVASAFAVVHRPKLVKLGKRSVKLFAKSTQSWPTRWCPTASTAVFAPRERIVVVSIAPCNSKSTWILTARKNTNLFDYPHSMNTSPITTYTPAEEATIKRAMKAAAKFMLTYGKGQKTPMVNRAHYFNGIS